MTQSAAPLYRRALGILVACACLVAGCVYRIDIQQGNLLEEDAVAQVEVGMSQSAVQFLLGTPMLADPFHANRWDYPYYLKRGRAKEAQQRWVVVYFEEGRVSRIDRELAVAPSS